MASQHDEDVLALDEALTALAKIDEQRALIVELRFFGGVDSRNLMQGPAAIERELEHTVRPLLEQGGYVPYLDDRIRPYVPFENFKYYRRRLNELIDEKFKS